MVVVALPTVESPPTFVTCRPSLFGAVATISKAIFARFRAAVILQVSKRCITWFAEMRSFHESRDGIDQINVSQREHNVDNLRRWSSAENHSQPAAQ